MFFKNFLIEMKVHKGIYVNNSKKLVNKRFYFTTVSLLMISKLKTLSFFIPESIINSYRPVPNGDMTTVKANDHYAICNNVNEDYDNILYIPTTSQVEHEVELVGYNQKYVIPTMSTKEFKLPHPTGGDIKNVSLILHQTYINNISRAEKIQVKLNNGFWDKHQYMLDKVWQNKLLVLRNGKLHTISRDNIHIEQGHIIWIFDNYSPVTSKELEKFYEIFGKSFDNLNKQIRD